jgi:hypothetical protein
MTPNRMQQRTTQLVVMNQDRCRPRSGHVHHLWMLLLVSVVVRAASLEVPNGSFESPATGFVDTRINAWQERPKPDWYEEGGGFSWSQLTGVFRNTPPTSADHIVNVDGDQAAYLFALPGVGLFQDYESVDWSSQEPSHEFDVRFEPGKSYSLSVGVAGGGGNMAEGVTLELSLYYLDAAGDRVPVVVTMITNSAALFPSNTHLVDFEARVPEVQADDPWAHRHLGVQILSTVESALAGGYWNLDHVRLVETETGFTLAIDRIDSQVALTLQSEPGLRFEIFAAPDVGLPAGDWTSLGVVTNGLGTLRVEDPEWTTQRFYRAQQVP